ncbi:Response regulator receiver domain-containing protein [Monaibacterium marinum]|uniref:Response regulator receiver domain-containing protein n=1 Tax=Pontivivens marinum TaxID=1690039 RepID=A0A2C9CST7_9RHOB|nr:response regulator [Monaibacterium marinum]SOH94571.1 Response regulator receiver domain-containing protein [Monaibacterium marinum]
MKTIVIMEDDIALAAEWQLHLEQAGYIVVQTNGASECLEYLSDNHADLVIADVYVQRDGVFVGDGGIKLIGLLRATGGKMAQPALPVICVSGVGGGTKHLPPVLELAKSMGANAVFQKPVAFSDLIKCIEALLPATDHR